MLITHYSIMCDSKITTSLLFKIIINNNAIAWHSGRCKREYQEKMFQPLDTITPATLPQTVKEVVDIIYGDLSLRDRVVMSKLSEPELDSTVYLAMAKTLRKEFRLYEDNYRLIASCKSYLGTVYDDYEDPAMVIIKELWKKIKKAHHLRLLKPQ